jgi:hypothetical protein
VPSLFVLDADLSINVAFFAGPTFGFFAAAGAISLFADAGSMRGGTTIGPKRCRTNTDGDTAANAAASVALTRGGMVETLGSTVAGFHAS